MKKTLLLMLLTAFTAVASFAQPAKRIEQRHISSEQLSKMLAAKPKDVKNTSVPCKAFPSPASELTFTPWPDFELTYGNTDGDVAGNKNALLSEITEQGDDEYNYASLEINNTNLVNVANPDDQLLMALQFLWESSTYENLEYYIPLLVGGQEFGYTETNYKNESIKTFAGQRLEYLYIDNYGTDEDFAKVKDALAGKIAVCNRGEVSFYIKANAAMANGAIGIIVVNNTVGDVSMALEEYEYTNPAISVTMETGALLKDNAEYITDGEAPYYVGTLEMGEVMARQLPVLLEFGKFRYEYGEFENYIKDYSIKALVPDWTNATPGATYKATITYSNCRYHLWDTDINGYDVHPVEIGTPSTTVTVVIPGGENSIYEVNADRSANSPTYNLMGIRVGKEYKGIVIQNGKKILR
ncbi:MAG: hypothetical protein IJV23_09045 [Prevotella sp.]|nr:hypothetical protein [Prevotella sp.]